MGGHSGPSKAELERQKQEAATAALNKEINEGIASKSATGTTSMIGGEQRFGTADLSMIKQNQELAGRSAMGRGAGILTGGVGSYISGTKTLLGG